MITSGGTTTLGLYDNASAISKKADIEYVDETVGNLQGLLNSVGTGNRAYKTYAEMDADKANIPAKSKVTVTNDETASNNGDWQWDGAVFTKSAYDPLTQAKEAVIQNLLFDPFSETVSADKSDTLQCNRSAVFSSIIENSSNSPFQKRALSGDSTVGIRRFIDAQKLGLRVGDKFKIRILAHYSETLTDSRITAYLRKTDNTVIDSNATPTVVGLNDFLSKEFTFSADVDHILIDIAGATTKELIAISIATTVEPRFTYGALPAKIANSFYEIDNVKQTITSMVENLMPDPIFNAYGLGVKTVDGFNYFDEVSTTWALVDYADSPFPSKKAMFFAAPVAAKNKKIDFSRLGLKAGDTLTARVGIISPTSGNIQIALYVYNSAGSIVGTTDATTNSLTANTYTECLRTITLTQAQIDSGAYVRLRINVANTVFSSGIYVCALALYKNNTTETIKYTSAIEDSLRVQINSALAVPEVTPFTLNEFALREFRQRSRKLKIGDDAKLIIASIGDSWTYGRTRYIEPCLNQFITDYGNGGAGWFGFGYHPTLPTTVNGNARSIFTCTRTGAWTTTYAVDSVPRSSSPDSCHITSSTAESKLTCVIPETLDGCDLFYLGSSTGVIKYRFNSGTWTILNLNTVADLALGIVPLTGFNATDNTLEIEVVSGTVNLCGCNYKSNARGVTWHKLGATGSLAHNWARLPETDWKNALSALAPNVVTILLVTNDQFVTTQDPTTFSNNIRTLITRVKSALPSADILVMMPPENARENNKFLMKDYSYQAFKVCESEKVAFLDFQKVFGDQVSQYKDKWLGADGFHPSTDGNYVLTDALLRLLLN